jgi:hypothetical protein
MKYKLPDFDVSKFPMVYAGLRKRHATATDVSFVNEDTILVASYLNKKIYLIDISNNDFKIKTEITTSFYPDLMDYKDGLIITTNRSDKKTFGCISVYKLTEDKIILEKDIIRKDFNQLHGCVIIDENNVIVSNTDDNNRCCVFLDLREETVKIFNDFKFYPKDIFILNNRMLITSSSSRPSTINKVKLENSIIYLFEFPSLKKITELEFYGQTDGITINGDDGFVTLQGQDSLFHFKLENDVLSPNGTIEGFNFPHGVASYGDKMVVTNYGDNSIDVLYLSELIKK